MKKGLGGRDPYAPSKRARVKRPLAFIRAPEPIAVYGASGSLGELVVRELHRRGVAVVAAGRHEEKLRRLAAELAPGVAFQKADTQRWADFRELMENCGVVINCCRPDCEATDPLIRAAITAGNPYLDGCSEPEHLKLLVKRFEEQAVSVGVPLVMGCGFFGGLGDLLAAAAAPRLEYVHQVSIGYAQWGAQPTPEAAFGGYPTDHYSLSEDEGQLPDGRFDFPAPLGRQRTIDYRGGETRMLPRHLNLQLQRVRTTAASSGSALRSSGPLRERLRRWRGQDGAAEPQAAGCVVAARLAADDGKEISASVQGGRIYDLTAAVLAEAAAEVTEFEYDRCGVLTPAEALDADGLLSRLQHSRYEVEAQVLPLEWARQDGEPSERLVAAN